MKEKQDKKSREINQVDYEDELDFGGLPKNISLTKNIGCASSSKTKKINKSKNGQ